ncbi:hypothetical protein DFH09DRAFT_399475 [Mycena vulgaris]|nr:hypothetical protein DFH09DRAFT_399475 [Mycena vulgaris]
MSFSRTPPEGRCEYNLSWMDRTFRSRKNSESLLVPELANGNLTPGDYERLMTSLPGLQYSDLTGFTISGVGALLYSHFKPPPKITVGLVGYLVGLTLGKGLRMYTHQTYFRSIENINGFSRAMDNVKRKVGYAPGLLSLSRPLSVAEGDQLPFQQEAGNLPVLVISTVLTRVLDTPYGESPEPMAAAAPVSATPQEPLAKSRWDEIRAARRVDGPGKAWENIRQGRKPDGTSSPKQTASDPSESESGSSWTPRDSDRAAEQASFDAMLERERKMSSS